MCCDVWGHNKSDTTKRLNWTELTDVYSLVASLVAQMVNNLLAVQEPQVPSLGWEDPLERGMATYSRILTWRIPWTEEPGGLRSTRSKRVGHNWVTNRHLGGLHSGDLKYMQYKLYLSKSGGGKDGWMRWIKGRSRGLGSRLVKS